MEEIKGEKYKLAGIGVQQKGTLVDVFAKFARVDEDIDDIMAKKKRSRALLAPCWAALSRCRVRR